MSKSMTSKMLAGAAMVAVLVVLGVSQAGAALVLDARISDGTTSKDVSTAIPGVTTYDIDVYAQITGVNPDPTAPEGLAYVYFSLLSHELGLAGDIDATVRSNIAPFNATGAQPGLIQDLNGDGNLDVGSASLEGDLANADYAKPRSAGAQMSFDEFGDPNPIGQAIPNGWEFRIERIRVRVNTLPGPGESIVFTVEPPAWMPGNSVKTANFWEDNIFNNGSYQGDPSGVTTLLFVTLGGLGMIGTGLARRRARKA